MQRRCLPALAIWSLVAAAGMPAVAAPLDEEACEQLKQEVKLLESRGTRANMANGPAWAKSNLAKDKLAEIKSLIEIEEALAFRCPQPKPTPPKEETAAAGAASATAAKPAPARARAQPKKEARAKKEASGERPRQPEKAKVKQADKAKSKAKVDDSYRPPRRTPAPPAKAQTGSIAAPRPAQSAATPPPPAFTNPFTSAR